MVSAPARLQQAKYAHRRGLSSRMACALLEVSRSMWKYQYSMSVRWPSESPVRSRKVLAFRTPREALEESLAQLKSDGGKKEL